MDMPMPNVPTLPTTTSSGSGVSNEQLLAFMQSEREVRKTEHGDVLNSLNELKGKTAELQAAIEAEKITREKEIQTLRLKIEEVEQCDKNWWKKL